MLGDAFLHHSHRMGTLDAEKKQKKKTKKHQTINLKPLQPFLPSAPPFLPLAVPSRTALSAPTPPRSPQPKLKQNAKPSKPGPARRAQHPSLRGSEPDGARQDGEGPSRPLMAVGEAALRAQGGGRWSGCWRRLLGRPCGVGAARGEPSVPSALGWAEGAAGTLLCWHTAL